VFWEFNNIPLQRYYLHACKASLESEQYAENVSRMLLRVKLRKKLQSSSFCHGVYYKRWYFLSNQDCRVSILVPKKLAHYAQTLDIKSKTDDLNARLITRFALERALPLWHRRVRACKRCARKIRI
jgi:hypothetical protein